MDKPNWDLAPEWAKWLAADTTTETDTEFLVFFEAKPLFVDGGWMVNPVGGKWLQTDTPTEIGFDFKNSLEARP